MALVCGSIAMIPSSQDMIDKIVAPTLLYKKAWPCVKSQRSLSKGSQARSGPVRKGVGPFGALSADTPPHAVRRPLAPRP